ncbi:MAG: M67 family metallopeptidase [Nitrospirae bacterium]|nr:M67 family metallopeptidase [Nitrospirota bacterium]
MEQMYLNNKVIEEISLHALKTYPEECCGIVTGNDDRQTAHPCLNIQNSLHAEDPGRYPRDARTAYTIDRKEIADIVSLAKQKGEGIIAFYHSHPEHDPYFSQDDKDAQTVFGEPEWPDTFQVVVSVKAGKIHDMKCYKWDREKKDFIQNKTSATNEHE